MTSVADRIHSWSVRERQLAGTIESFGLALRSPLEPAPYDRPTTNSRVTSLPHQTVPAGGDRPLTDSVQHLADWIRSLSERDRQLAVAIAGLGTGTAAGSQPGTGPAESHPNGTMGAAPLPPTVGHDECPSEAPPPAPGDSDATDSASPGAPPPLHPLDDFISSISTSGPASPFDDLITAVARQPTRGPSAGPLPPPARFRVRVAEVGRPHRATKRNYDYFEELNSEIAARAELPEDHRRPA